ncbi:MAG TPA: lipid A deacylase LpxR family protein [Bacteroidia bacterium]|nr:lipid A deacylase LpxR family protein [Bacteroidia bacterium]
MVQPGKIFSFVFLLLQLILCKNSYCQKETPTYMFRAYEDDDYLNDLGLGTDKAYTSGEQLNFYYTLNHRPRFFLDKWVPKAGDSCINIYSIGLMQIMYTPDYLTTSYYVYNDYSYAGAMVGKHSLYSYNPQKKYDLQTEFVFGVIGPASLAGAAQHWLHTVLKDTAVPGGWGNQYNNAPLLNLNFNIEKELYSNKGVEAIADGGIYAGTMFDGFELGTSVYIGKMHPYFNGLISQLSTSFKESEKGVNKVQFYFMMKVAGQYVLYSAMLQGGLFTPQPMVKTIAIVNSEREIVYVPKPKQDIENFVGYAEYGPVLAYRHFSISYTQIYSSPVLKNVYSYIYGNVSIYYSW